MLIPLKPILQQALNGRYAVGSFNVANFEMMETVVETAVALNSPVIISTAAAEVRYLGADVAVAMARALAQKHSATFVLHLDHGDSFELALTCIRAGYSSIMFDGSHYPLEENIRMTREVVRTAHAVGVSVEGEIGRLQGVEDDITVEAAEAALSDVDEAERFVRETAVDALAVAIGNAHGFYTQEPKLDLARLEAIRARTAVPIVLHGGTGIPAAQVQQAIQRGIAKMNVASRVRRGFMTAVYYALTPNPHTTEVRGIMAAGRQRMRQEIEESMHILGSVGRG